MGSNAKFDRTVNDPATGKIRNPGFPFWIADATGEAEVLVVDPVSKTTYFYMGGDEYADGELPRLRPQPEGGGDRQPEPEGDRAGTLHREGADPGRGDL